MQCPSRETPMSAMTPGNVEQKRQIDNQMKRIPESLALPIGRARLSISKIIRLSAWSSGAVKRNVSREQRLRSDIDAGHAVSVLPGWSS